MTADYTRTIWAATPEDATRAVRHMAKRDGLRCRTTKRVALAEPGDPQTGMPRYTVTLAVEPLPVGVDCE
jgi:hypothetical protein